MIRILLCDDHEVVRMGLKALLEHRPNLKVVAEASSGEQAIERTAQFQPQVVVMDIRMPGISGVEACRLITAKHPQTRVVILTSYAEDELLISAIQAGAAGYVLKRIGGDDLIKTIEAVANGESALDPSLMASMFKELKGGAHRTEVSAFARLTPQETRILALIAEGMTNKEIGGKLFLGEGTVRNYVSNILSKLSLSNRAEAAAYAVQHHIQQHLNQD
jgi:DNA-binding NarL/FixJ family response regulator